MTNPHEYVSTPIPKDCHFKISPSAFANFIQSPHNWYRSEVAGEEGFSHNTSSVIGTCVHYCAEQVAKGEDVDKQAIIEYIDSKEITDDYDPEIVKAQWQTMAERLVNDYVLEHSFLGVEVPLVAEVKQGYAAAGTSDFLGGSKEDTLIGDYKTYNSKTKPKAIPMNYRYQLLVYAWLASKNGFNPTRIRLVYVNRHIDGGISEKTGNPLKSYPPEVTILTETITIEDLEFIESLLELAVDTVEAGKKHPELIHVIFHDPRLKQ